MAKNNNEKFFRRIKFAITVGTLLVVVTLAYASLKAQVDANGASCEMSRKNQLCIAKMEEHLAYLRKGVDEIKVTLKEKE